MRGTGRAEYDGPAMGHLDGCHERPGRTNLAGGQKKRRVDSSGSSALEPRMEPSGGTRVTYPRSMSAARRAGGPIYFNTYLA